MPTEFDPAFALLIKHEGTAYVDDPDDSGGATHYGVSLKFLQRCGQLDLADIDHDGVIDHKDVEGMTLDEAKAIYRKDWWDNYKYGLFYSQRIANKVLDMSVHMGPSRGHKNLQGSLNKLGFPVAVDGVLGSHTLSAVNAADPDALCHQYMQACASFYEYLASRKPVLVKFLKGWLNRVWDEQA